MQVDPEGEDRKGGAGDLAKVFFSAGDKMLSIICHVPKECTEVTAKEYMDACLVPVADPKVVVVSEHMIKCEVQGNPDKGIFPLKLRSSSLKISFSRSRESHLMDRSLCLCLFCARACVWIGRRDGYAR